MLNRFSIVVLIAGAITGYALAGRSVEARQAQPIPFTIGETVTLGLAQHASQPSFGTSIECTVTEFRGVYVKCGQRNMSGGLTQTDRWVSMEYVVLVTKRER